jgi:hypothetical protein
MLFLPGPGLVVILGGLAVLGREAPWARRVDHRLRARLRLGRRAHARTTTPTPVPCAQPATPSVRNLTE